MRIYISHALTHVPRHAFQTYVSFIHRLAESLKSEHTVKYALVDSDPQLSEKPFEERAHLCYLWDRRMVEEADVLIADATFPSIGLGIELQLAEPRNLPIILCFRNSIENKASPVTYENPDHTRHNLQIGEGFVSLMALGIPSVFRVICYKDDDEGIQSIKQAVELLKN